MVTEVMPYIERYGVRFPKKEIKVKKIDTDKKANNDKRELNNGMLFLFG